MPKKQPPSWSSAGEYRSVREAIARMSQECDKFSCAHQGTDVTVKYVDVREVVEFIEAAERDIERLVQCRQILSLMHLPDA